jgi:hypothetical protein
MRNLGKKKKKKKHCPSLVSAFIKPVFINQLFEKNKIVNKFRRHFDPSNAHRSSLSSRSSSWLLFVDGVFHHPNSATSLHILRNKNPLLPPKPTLPFPSSLPDFSEFRPLHRTRDTSSHTHRARLPLHYCVDCELLNSSGVRRRSGSEIK